MKNQTEHNIYMMVADYMRYKHPDIIYRFDLAADLKLTMGQAAKHKRLQHFRGYPDLFIAAPCYHDGELYHGLFLEIKKDGTKIYRKDGRLVADEHIREQFDMLVGLQKLGYFADFAIGFDSCCKMIDWYLDDEL